MVLKELTALRSVSGDEGAVRAYIAEKAKALGAEVKIDRLGNVIAAKKGNGRSPKHVMLCAHMDEVGLIIKGVNDNGLLSYETVGGIDPRVMVSKRVQVGKDAVPGVIGAKAIHLQSPADRARLLGHEDLYIDIGAKDKAEAEKLVSQGDYASLFSPYAEFGDGFVRAGSLDDRVGCYNLLRILEGEWACDVTCGFTVMEEVGCLGAKVLGNQVRPDCALILETTAANDLGDVPDHLQVANLGRGVAVSFMDRASIAHPGLNRALTDLADEHKIAWQVKRFVSGGNDGGAIQTAQGAVACCVLSVPCRYIHSHASTANLRDIEAQYQLASAFLLSGAND